MFSKFHKKTENLNKTPSKKKSSIKNSPFEPTPNHNTKNPNQQQNNHIYSINKTTNLNNPRDYPLTTKSQMPLDCIDYTFRQNRNKIELLSKSDSTKSKINIKINEHLYDLDNTFMLNKECIIAMIPSLGKFDKKQVNELTKNMEKINEYYLKKKQLRNKKNEINGRILINKQIIEKSKKLTDENIVYYDDKLEDFKESVEKKYTSVKQYQKKFVEVEIFVQRESQYPSNIQKYGKWANFCMNTFIYNNETLLKVKSFIDSFIKERITKAHELIEENKFMQSQMKRSYTFANNDRKYNTIDSIIFFYEALCKFRELVIEQLNIYIEIIVNNYKYKEKIPPFTNYVLCEMGDEDYYNNLHLNIQQYTNRDEFQSQFNRGKKRKDIDDEEEDSDKNKKNNISDLKEEDDIYGEDDDFDNKDEDGNYCNRINNADIDNDFNLSGNDIGDNSNNSEDNKDTTFKENNNIENKWISMIENYDN